MNPIERLALLVGMIGDLADRLEGAFQYGTENTFANWRDALKRHEAELRAIIAALKQRDEAVRCIALDLEFMGGLDGTTSTESLTIAARLRAAMEGE